MRQKENYVAPELTVVEFKVEKGFASSLDPAAAALGTMVLGDISGNDIRMGAEMDELTVGEGQFFTYTGEEGGGGGDFYSGGGYF